MMDFHEGLGAGLVCLLVDGGGSLCKFCLELGAALLVVHVLTGYWLVRENLTITINVRSNRCDSVTCRYRTVILGLLSE